MEDTYCAHCIKDLSNSPPPNCYHINGKQELIRPRTFNELIDAIATYGSKFIDNNSSINYRGYAETFVDGTALCRDHAMWEMNSLYYRRKQGR